MEPNRKDNLDWNLPGFRLKEHKEPVPYIQLHLYFHVNGV